MKIGIKKIIVLLCFVTFSMNTFGQSENIIRSDSLDLMIGQMILIGIGDRTIVEKKDSLLWDIKHGKIGGVILFEKNINKKNPIQKLKELTNKLQNDVKIPLFIAIDEEGGKVHRLKEKYGFVGMPSAYSLGMINQYDTTYYYNDILSKELYEFGINVNFAPSVDLAINPNNEVLYKTNRCYSHDPAIVTQHAIACIDAHKQNNIITVLKHFPGHGSSTADSHFGMVNVEAGWTLKEVYPFNNIIEMGKCDAVMTAHIINKRWDTTQLPATLSYQVIQQFLRGYIGFRGVVFSDDMQMKAISKEYGLEAALALGINAGLDVVLFGNNVVATDRPLQGREIHSIIKKLVYENQIPISRIRESYERIIKLKSIFYK